jgi:hypothetical protein
MFHLFISTKTRNTPESREMIPMDISPQPTNTWLSFPKAINNRKMARITIAKHMEIKYTLR